MIYGISYGASPSYASYALQRASAETNTQKAQHAVAQPERGNTVVTTGIHRAAQPETPVQPVSPVSTISTDEASKADMLLRMETDPVAMAVRGRIQPQEEVASPVQTEAENKNQALFGEEEVNPYVAQLEEKMEKKEKALEEAKAAEMKEAREAEEEKKAERAEELKAESAQEVMEEAECQTCAKRKYQDGSDDPGVSFKTPTHIAPQQSASAVLGHELEHVVREQAQATREEREVISQSVRLKNAICPECGTVYVSGGVTNTTTAAVQKTEPANNENIAAKVFSAVA